MNCNKKKSLDQLMIAVIEKKYVEREVLLNLIWSQ
jgi:hypothetical protein